MAASRSIQQAPIGSAKWIEDESSLAQSYVSQEVEDFSYSVRNELDWLNEHMAGILEGTSFDVIEAFKTPGKLRGKTPHTARRADLLPDQTVPAPVFAQPPPTFKLPSPVRGTKVNNFEVAEDVNDEHVQSPSPQQHRFSLDGKENARVGPKVIQDVPAQEAAVEEIHVADMELDPVLAQNETEQDVLEHEKSPLRSPSPRSPPSTKMLRKKSSLTFATLPARELMTSKKSIHEKLAMLSKSSQPRLSKSIPSLLAQAREKENAVKENAVKPSMQQQQEDHENDDDWISPISGSKHTLGSDKKPLAKHETLGEQEKIHDSLMGFEASPVPVTTDATIPAYSTIVPVASAITSSPTSKLPVVSYPKLTEYIESTTPVGSPNRSKAQDGAVSVSKSKLFSVLKSAKGFFAGSTTSPMKSEQHEVSIPVVKAPTAPTVDSLGDAKADVPPPVPPKPSTQIPKPGDLRQPPGETRRVPPRFREGAATRPAPVPIKLASQRIPTLHTKASSSSCATSASAQSSQTASSGSTRPKALEERRAALEAEQKRALEAKNAAQRQAAEQRRAEAIRKNEQLRQKTVTKTIPAKRPIPTTAPSSGIKPTAPRLPPPEAPSQPKRQKHQLSDTWEWQKKGHGGPPDPHKTPGDDIKLPDIATDSESDGEGGDDSFVPPAWAASPALRELLRQQQLIDPAQVFGPIAPLVMEEVFRGNLERHARFRDRTSSAMWTRDMLTAEEVRRDREARERLEREGGWTFRPGQ